jgi:LytS/YehU family sensor histidine kinase
MLGWPPIIVVSGIYDASIGGFETTVCSIVCWTMGMMMMMAWVLFPWKTRGRQNTQDGA